MICSRCQKLKYHMASDKICWDCQKDDENKKTGEDVAKAGTSSYEKEIFCPYCGCSNSDDEVHENTVMTCYDCEKDFDVEVDYDIRYSTYRKEGK